MQTPSPTGPGAEQPIKQHGGIKPGSLAAFVNLDALMGDLRALWGEDFASKFRSDQDGASLAAAIVELMAEEGVSQARVVWWKCKGKRNRSGGVIHESGLAFAVGLGEQLARIDGSIDDENLKEQAWRVAREYCGQGAWDYTYARFKRKQAPDDIEPLEADDFNDVEDVVAQHMSLVRQAVLDAQTPKAKALRPRTSL